MHSFSPTCDVNPFEGWGVVNHAISKQNQIRARERHDRLEAYAQAKLALCESKGHALVDGTFCSRCKQEFSGASDVNGSISSTPTEEPAE